MKQLIYNILFVVVLITGFACSDMNDLHDKYLKEGETLYIGKVDSARLFPGNERMLVRYWITDIRAKELQVFWSGKTAALTLTIPDHQPEEPVEFMIDPIVEGDHELLFFTNDKERNSSVKFEALQSVYGAVYKSTLTNRPVQETLLAGNKLSVLWSGSLSDQETGLNIAYATSAGKDEFLTLKPEALAGPVVLENVDLSKGVRYQTLYLPQPEAIDTFATEMSRIPIIQRINVALNKTVTADSYATSGPWLPDYAVDGKRNDNASRWLTTTGNHAEHWLAVDLGQTYMIDGFKTYIGANGTFSNPVPNFEFQIEVDGEWQALISVTGNVDPQYGTNFAPVAARKVRYYIPAYTNNQVRLYELEVYATIEY